MQSSDLISTTVSGQEQSDPLKKKFLVSLEMMPRTCLVKG